MLTGRNFYTTISFRYETTSSTMSFCLYELAMNPDIQQKVRQEILNVLEKFENKITYECLAELKYLQMVIDG